MRLGRLFPYNDDGVLRPRVDFVDQVLLDLSRSCRLKDCCFGRVHASLLTAALGRFPCRKDGRTRFEVDHCAHVDSSSTIMTRWSSSNVYRNTWAGRDHQKRPFMPNVPHRVCSRKLSVAGTRCRYTGGSDVRIPRAYMCSPINILLGSGSVPPTIVHFESLMRLRSRPASTRENCVIACETCCHWRCW